MYKVGDMVITTNGKDAGVVTRVAKNGYEITWAKHGKPVFYKLYSTNSFIPVS